MRIKLLFGICWSLSLLFLACNQSAEVIERWDNGNVKIEHDSIININSYIEKSYYRDGQICSEAGFKNGKRNGKYIGYYPNGKMVGELYYLNDTVNGKVVEYFKDGSLMFEGQQKMGRLTGLIKRYHTTHRLASEEFFNDSGKVVVRKWDSMGTLVKNF